MSVVRHVLATLIWLVDFVLKLAVGQILAGLLWLPYWVFGGAGYPFAFKVLGIVLGVCIVGFFEGCDIILIGFAKRIVGEK